MNMYKKTGILLAIISFLSGIITGFLLAPIKNGIGNDSGNNYNYYGDSKDSNDSKE